MSGSNSAERKRYEPLVLVETADLSEEDWLDYRRRGIGGSDVSAIFGTSPFRTARDLYYDKLNIASVEDDEGNWVAMEMGHLLEPLVAKIFERKTGYRVYQIKKMFQHPQYPWMLADVDYFVELPDGTTAILEIKTTNYNARDNWWMNGKETVPVYYESQGRHYMAVTDLDRCFFSMAKKLHMNVYDEIVYRTRKLRRRHDDLVLKCQEKDIELQAEEMEEKFPHVNAICQEIKTKYEYADADYMVVVPDGILDIITEGRALHHCAGSSDRYWDRIERRESFVVFLRKTADPFHAYYTLEVEPDGTVRQKRTEYDRQKKDIEQATEFLQKWQRVITARLTESDKALAAESRILREKEFIQLKKDRVIIHTGHLAGRLLADVLMADLMENTDSIQSPVLAAAA